MPEQSEGNNYKSEIHVFSHVAHDLFSTKWSENAPCRAKKSIF